MPVHCTWPGDIETVSAGLQPLKHTVNPVCQCARARVFVCMCASDERIAGVTDPRTKPGGGLHRLMPWHHQATGRVAFWHSTAADTTARLFPAGVRKLLAACSIGIPSVFYRLIGERGWHFWITDWWLRLFFFFLSFPLIREVASAFSTLSSCPSTGGR